MKRKKVIINVGIPGSGKSTWSKDFIEKNPNWVKICRDDFRFMLKNAPFLDGKGENLITDLVFTSARKSLLSGFNVILDATHVRKSYINQVERELGEMADIDFQVFDTPLKTCIERDSLRERKVGKDVIFKMHENFENLKKEFNFEPIHQKSRLKKDHSTDWDLSLPDVVITDIDGTVAHMNGKRGPFEWHNVGVDDPDHAMIKVLQAWKASGEKVIAVSGRDGSCRAETEKWLRDNGVPFDSLYMRPAGDFRKDSLIKAEIYENNLKGKYNIVMIYDDRDQVVETWRSLGLKCAQVEPGSF